MAYHDMNRYAPRLGRPSSRHMEHQHALPTMSSSRRATDGMSYLHNSPLGHQRTNSNMHFNRSPENASSEDGTTPLTISPHETDVNYMLSQAPYADEPRADSILSGPSHLHVPDRPLTFDRGHLPPWNGLRTEGDYRAMAAETTDEMFHSIVDQNMFLNVPDNTRSHGTGGTRRSFSTVDTQYTASSDGRSDVSQERTAAQRPRGGRQPGSRLPEHRVQNVRQVRDVGACFRCTVLRERCTPGTPCETCSNVNGRIWCGCLRSFKPLTTLLTPEILAKRLGSEALKQWMSINTCISKGQIEFDLPLSFGFGRPFIGFRGVEYVPTTDEARRTHAVGHGDAPLFSQSLYVYPVNSTSRDVQKLVWEWLKQTLMSRSSMEEWLNTCFRGSRAQWIRDLLQVIREYSYQCWDDGLPQELDQHQIDRTLLDAWMACLLVTILSLPITIPTPAISTIVSYSQFEEYAPPYPNTSRALTKCVKSLLFDIYRRFVERLASSLEKFDQLKPDGISERHTAHIMCISILIMVLTSQIQTSLMDNSRIDSALDVDQGIWEQTLEQLQKVEGVFKNTTLYVRYKRREWFDCISVEDIEGSRLLALRRNIRDIEQRHGDAIDRYSKVQLETLKTRASLFHIPNAQRVFAFFLHDLRKEGRSRRAR